VIFLSQIKKNKKGISFYLWKYVLTLTYSWNSEQKRRQKGVFLSTTKSFLIRFLYIWELGFFYIPVHSTRVSFVKLFCNLLIRQLHFYLYFKIKFNCMFQLLLSRVDHLV
jgi:hypothetical protein